MKKGTSEKVFEKRLRVLVHGLGGKALKFKSAYDTGWPDRFIFVPPGLVFLAELKSEGKKPDRKQEVRIKRARQMGFTVFVINSDETLKQAIDEISAARLSATRH